jgi:hypothetical protein
MAMTKAEREAFELMKRQRDEARELLRRFLDEQTPSRFYSEHWLTGRIARRFIQADAVTIEVDGLTVEISKDLGKGIRVSFMADTGTGGAAIIPVASNVINIVSLVHKRKDGK